MAAIYRNVAFIPWKSEESSACIYHPVVCYFCPLCQDGNKLQPPSHVL